eukprot:gnl/TRDRNA2_/TRDRNA2_160600_c0_seq1.p2 gnl/TRDRNA2_/TRDRNA2_160600_c0~~gnl/TRDRNA2_/TRDRNA2_160600_c0_seq1.p2  ORF type:complete len:103 (-),score=4.81 gnl/TRDRNA2_/TRDRNA2_160600_c0_seq1:344-652(-)
MCKKQCCLHALMLPAEKSTVRIGSFPRPRQHGPAKLLGLRDDLSFSMTVCLHSSHSHVCHRHNPQLEANARQRQLVVARTSTIFKQTRLRPMSNEEHGLLRP